MESIRSEQLDMLSAALRHLTDAQCLTAESPDQSFHLAGLAHECALKATLADPRLNQAIGHPGDPAELPAVECALALDPLAARYRTTKRGPALSEWTLNCRYSRTGAWAPHGPGAVNEAAETFGAIAAAIFADGRIPETFRW